MNLSGPAAEVAQNGVGKLALHLDVLLAGNGVARAAVRRAGVAEQLAKEVGQEVGQDFLFLEGVRLARREQVGPVLQLGAEGVNVGRQLESRKVRAENIGAEQRLGFDGHGGNLLEAPILRCLLHARYPSR